MERKEESEELGGYFIVNGIEKLVRLLILSRRNFPMALIRPSFAKRGKSYSSYGVSIRSVRPDQTSQTNVIHYLNDGNIIFRFSWRKNEFLVPAMMILKALAETTDREIFESIVGPPGSKATENTFLTDRVELMLRTYKVYGLYGMRSTRAYLGQKFRIILGVSEQLTDEAVGEIFLHKIVLVHLGYSTPAERRDGDKFKLLLFMIKKLYALVGGDCVVDNPDTVQNQEVLLGGFLMAMILKEKLEEWLTAIRLEVRAWLMKVMLTPEHPDNLASPLFTTDFASPRLMGKTNENIGGLLEYFLSTGNLVSPTGLDFQQVSGYTVVAEKINFSRFISHFRMVHRGSYYAQMKTTTVRKLLPESWGFLCPVHTPDGAPCGLLNHLAHKCLVTTSIVNTKTVPSTLYELGVTPSLSAGDDAVIVQLDGRIVGWCSPAQSRIIANTLRFWKVSGERDIPIELEIGWIPISRGGQYPGLYLFSQQARMIRPVKYLPLDKLDYVGPFEQPYLSIATVPEEIKSNRSSHVEYSPTNILSILANLTPFSDYNQSPRNMYQCQMAKQTMGVPGTALAARADNKLYRLQCGQTPIVRAPLHNEYGFDNFVAGTNAVVAVISYTGYDMDDAMIIAKQAHDRGFAQGHVFKTKTYDLQEKGNRVQSLFGFAPGGTIKPMWRNFLDEDGLPNIGTILREGDPIAAYHTVTLSADGRTYINRDSHTSFFRYKDPELCYVNEVRLLGADTGDQPLQKISIKLRTPRQPNIGDKFSSRHGQKGVCSFKWPSQDMPFSETGIVPDVIINPHAFPSRMTIGMFVESLAGKAGALHGLAQDGSPWQFSDVPGERATEYFGEQLRAAGFDYFGNEPMYSGITGEELKADVYVGVVYYQRLRHMVNDKFQVRTTGPVDAITGQPVKGRSRGGGIRVGEMERDSLLAHGCEFLVRDRLLNCSDYTRCWICRQCGAFTGIMSVIEKYAGGGGSRGNVDSRRTRCRRCATKVDIDTFGETWEDGDGQKWRGGSDVRMIAIPAVLRFLDAELMAMGVRMRFDICP